MTREEAIKKLEHYRYCLKFQYGWYSKDDDEAFDMAIKALEQQTCEDCISRQAVLAIAGDSCLDLDNYEDTREFCDEINDLPPVAPQHKPCDDATKYFNAVYKISQVCGMPYSLVEDKVINATKALKELQQEPCEDAISRQEVLDVISELNAISFYEAQEDSKECYYEIRNAIKQLQPITPLPKIGYCKDCKYFEYDSLTKVNGTKLIFAHEICKRWGDGCQTKEDGYCFLFEPKMQEVKE